MLQPHIEDPTATFLFERRPAESDERHQHRVSSPTFLPGCFRIAFHTSALSKLLSTPDFTSPNGSAHFLCNMVHIAFYCSYRNQSKRLYVVLCRQPSLCVYQHSAFEIKKLCHLLAEYLSVFEIQV